MCPSPISPTDHCLTLSHLRKDTLPRYSCISPRHIYHAALAHPHVGHCRCNRYIEREPLVCRGYDTDEIVVQGCYFTVHSSTVGDFKVQHSEPSGKPTSSPVILFPDATLKSWIKRLTTGRSWRSRTDYQWFQGSVLFLRKPCGWLHHHCHQEQRLWVPVVHSYWHRLRAINDVPRSAVPSSDAFLGSKVNVARAWISILVASQTLP